MAVWTLTYNGVTQDLATWRIEGMQRKRKSGETDTVTFRIKGYVDAAQSFAQWKPLTILRNGKVWFTGIVTDVPRKASGKSESLNYEISGPWYWLEKTTFQQMWVTLDLSGGGIATMTTLRSSVILGQALNGVKMNSGQVMLEVLYYAMYAYQGVAFPVEVDVNNLPPAPNPADGPLPFQIGHLTPSITVPYSNPRDKSCADIIRLMMKYSPSAVAWLDYSTVDANGNPLPTLNIAQRTYLAGAPVPPGTIPAPAQPLPPPKTIQSLGTSIPVNGYAIEGFNPRPRYDLQVPVVVAKFEQKNTINGTSYDSLLVDQFPLPPVSGSQPRAWVQTIDLLGGETTTQTQTPSVRARPVLATDAVAMSWIFKREPWWKNQVQAPNNGPLKFQYDWGNISMAYLSLVLDPNDPLNTSNPANVPLDCHTLDNELLTGTIADWMTLNDGVVAALTMIEVWLSYSGNDPATMELFRNNPHTPKNLAAPGKGYYRQFYKTKVTNAVNKTYSELTSFTASEPVPQGYAQYLYNELAPLHFQGDFLIKELECSDLIPLGIIFNASDGLADWHQMNALVLSVTENIDLGTTSVQFGPPVALGLDTLAELFRANLGLLPTWKLQQRTTGKIIGGANVTDPKHAADTMQTAPPPPNPPTPWEISFTQAGGQWMGSVESTSLLMNSSSQGDIITISNLNTPIKVNPQGDIFYLEVPVMGGAPQNGTINTKSNGGTFDPALPAWDASGNAYLAGPGNQTFFRVPLAIIKPDSNGRPISVPCCVTNLLIYNETIGGYICLIAYPTASAAAAH
jgi:hypothetical protein